MHTSPSVHGTHVAPGTISALQLKSNWYRLPSNILTSWKSFKKGRWPNSFWLSWKVMHDLEWTFISCCHCKQYPGTAERFLNIQHGIGATWINSVWDTSTVLFESTHQFSRIFYYWGGSETDFKYPGNAKSLTSWSFSFQVRARSHEVIYSLVKILDLILCLLPGNLYYIAFCSTLQIANGQSLKVIVEKSDGTFHMTLRIRLFVNYDLNILDKKAFFIAYIPVYCLHFWLWTHCLFNGAGISSGFSCHYHLLVNAG